MNHPVELQSTVGKGTMFRVRIPLDRADAAPQPTTKSAAAITSPHRLDQLSVLCIDNEESILDGMRLLLSGWGCEVETAAGQEHALSLIAAGKHFDVVIADYHLDKATGIDAVTAIRARLGAVPAVLVTADRTADVRAEAERTGIGLLNKPIKPAALRAALSRFASLGKAAAE